VSKHHVTFALPPSGLKDVSVWLYHTAENKSWDFQSCTITPVTL